MNRIDALAEALGLGSDARAVIDPVLELYGQLDQEIAARSGGLDLPCKSGCDACCHESVFLSAPEFLAVAAELVATRTPHALAAIVDEMRMLADRFADELELLEEIPAGAERDEVAARVRFRCPLLGSDGRCTVYRSRELNARSFGQSWDGARDEPYGCGLTVGRLQVLGQATARSLADARQLRRRLADTVAMTERVHVYPWWFARYGALLL